MSIAEKLTTVAENMPKIFEAGKKSEYDKFWDIFQQNGTRAGYQYGFAGIGWTDETFKPKYNIKITSPSNGAFRGSRVVNFKEILESCGVELNLSACASMSDGFNNCSVLKTLPKLDFSNMGGTTNMFYNDIALESIDEIVFAERTGFTANTFYNCSSLTHMIVTGTIGQSGLDLHYSTLLDKESLLSVLNALQDKTAEGGTWTVTLGTENLGKLSDAEKAVATQKGWSLV